ncbi:MAG: aldehyde dehydrogenase family protein [Sphingobium sp.]
MINPARGTAFAEAPGCSTGQLELAVVAARWAFKPRRHLPHSERQRMLRAASEVLIANAEPLASLFTREPGRPLPNARSEMLVAAQWLAAFADQELPAHRIEKGDGQLVDVTNGVLKIGKLFRDIFPPGVLNIITGRDDLGPKMTAHSGFAKFRSPVRLHR